MTADLGAGPGGTLIGVDVRLPDGHTGQVWALGPPSPRNRRAGATPPRREQVWVALDGTAAVLIHVDELQLLDATHQHHQEMTP